MARGLNRSTTVLLTLLACVALTAAAPAAPPGAESISRVETGSDDPANLRSCPGPPNAGQTTGCEIIDTLPNGTSVQMICWRDRLPPVGGGSPRWFWVNVVDGPHPGEHGYLWSDLVSDQTTVPMCSGEDVPPPSDPPVATLAQGPPASAGNGYRYAVTLAGYAPDSDIEVLCYDSTADAAFYTFSLHTDGNGAAFTQQQCYSGDGPDHWVVAGNVESNTVAW